MNSAFTFRCSNALAHDPHDTDDRDHPLGLRHFVMGRKMRCMGRGMPPNGYKHCGVNFAPHGAHDYSHHVTDPLTGAVKLTSYHVCDGSVPDDSAARFALTFDPTPHDPLNDFA